MAQKYRCNLTIQKSRISRWLFVIVWSAGLFFGTSIFRFSGSVSSSVMHGLLEDSVSIVSLFSVSFLPFLFSAFAVSIGLPWLLFPICFAKALCFSYVSAAIMTGFHCAGWLVRLLFMFNDLLSVPMLFLYGLRNIVHTGRIHLWELLMVFSALLLIGSIDYCFVSPFLAML